MKLCVCKLKNTKNTLREYDMKSSDKLSNKDQVLWALNRDYHE